MPTLVPIRYVGDAVVNEHPISGRAKRWFPGELAAVPEPHASLLVRALKGFEIEAAGNEVENLAGWSRSSTGALAGLLDPDTGAARSALKPALLIATIQPQTAITGTTLEQVIARIAIPRANLTPTTAIRVETMWTCTSSANAKQVRIAHGLPSFVVDDGSAFIHWAGGSYTTQTGFSLVNHLYFAGSMNVQNGGMVSSVNGFGSSGGATVFTSSILYDNATALELAFTGKLALGSESLRLVGGMISVMSPSLDA
jgi:hypothetical protein